MHSSIQIRRFQQGEEQAIFAVYHSAIHLIASKDYSPEQIQAWAPSGMDSAQIAQRVQSINPFVAELNGEVVGYADLQSNGYIDHFFVSGLRPRSGIGTLLMQHILSQARELQIRELTSDVSRTAQPFYAKFGFTIVEQRTPEVRGVIVPNALMRLRLSNLA